MVSNKTLALFIILTVIVSLGGTLLSLNKLQGLAKLQERWVPTKEFTGLALGQVQLGITTNMSCNVDTNVSFGSAGQPGSPINISTEANNAANGYNDCTTNPTCYGLQINNTGNVNINITYNSSANGTLFLGGGPTDTEADFTTYFKNGTGQGAIEPGCQGTMTTGWNNVATNATTVCVNLTYADTNDMITMEFNVSIDPQTPSGTKNATITITCAQN